MKKSKNLSSIEAIIAPKHGSYMEGDQHRGCSSGVTGGSLFVGAMLTTCCRKITQPFCYNASDGGKTSLLSLLTPSK